VSKGADLYRGTNQSRYMSRVVELCCGGQCPVVVLEEDRVLIGEKDNTCVLRKDEWNALVEKILNGELSKL